MLSFNGIPPTSASFTFTQPVRHLALIQVGGVESKLSTIAVGDAIVNFGKSEMLIRGEPNVMAVVVVDNDLNNAMATGFIPGIVRFLFSLPK